MSEAFARRFGIFIVDEADLVAQMTGKMTEAITEVMASRRPALTAKAHSNKPVEVFRYIYSYTQSPYWIDQPLASLFKGQERP